jgi:hypothetical protein
VDRHHTKKTSSPPEIQKHGPECGHTRRITSNKAQHGAKRNSMEENPSKFGRNFKKFYGKIIEL